MKKLSLLFIPQSGNNYRASLLQPGFLGLFIAIYLLNQSILKSITIIKPGILGYSSEITVEKVLQQTNQQRQKDNLPPLLFNSALSESARLKAEDMFANDYWAHNSPEGSSPWDFIKSTDYQYSVAGENLAKDFYDTPSMVKAWMHSPTHRDNIVHLKYKETGIAVVNGVLGGIKTTLVVQHFGTPLVATTGQPTAEEKQLNSLPLASSQVLAQSQPSTVDSAPPISPVAISKTLSAIMFTIIIIALIVDGVVTLKNKTKRLAGSATGHIGFLLVILMLMLFTRQGSIF